MKYIASIIVIFLALSSVIFASQDINIKSRGIIFTGSQTIANLGSDTVAIGKWDNTIQIIKSKTINSDSTIPNLMQTLVLPSKNGVQMLSSLNNNAFISNGSATSLDIWLKDSSGNYKFYKKASYENLANAPGVANSGAEIKYGGKLYFISGHQNGCILIWIVSGNTLTLSKEINIHSHNPIKSPYPLKNIRGIAVWKNGLFVTGSEDGDLVLLNVKGETLYRTRYNPNAERGVNNIEIDGNYLIVSNCEVGNYDRNLWLYKLGSNQISYLDSLNLKDDQSLTQVFDFGVSIGRLNDEFVFFASTGEGILWYGSIQNDRLVLSGHKLLTPNLGAVTYFNSSNDTLYESSYDTGVFSVASNNGKVKFRN